jgi:eukaryotic-like serine/threonine-protein kinase
VILAPGTAVSPELRLEQKLGEGAMGSIWSAAHLSLGRTVAVKFVAAGLARDNPQAFERFQREAEVLEGFEHPHVVALYGRGQTPSGDPFFVMELLDGEPLVERLEREGVLTMTEMGRLVAQLGAALAAVHERGIVHRDVKAENIFVRGEEEEFFAKLFDFGLAKKPGESHGSKALTGLGMMVGTAEYMSPEQIVSSRDADHHADLWAFAVVCYVSLVAGLPFRGGNLADTFTQVRAAQFERPSTMRDDVPQAIDRWFERAFHMDRSHRFASAREMLEQWQLAARSTLPTAAVAAPGGGPLPAAPASLPASQPWPVPTPLEAQPATSQGAVIAVVAITVIAVFGVLAWLLL